MGNPSPHKARKRFGQHFLHDRRIIDQIIAAVNPRSGQSIVEIGPGQGALTLPLLRQCGELTAIELDRDLIGLLQQRAAALGKLHLINQDVLKVKLADLALQPPVRLVGNLPYNISTPLMFHLLQQSDWIQDMHFMVQKEVALRIIARANDPSGNSKHYGRLSVMLQYYCSSQFLFDVPPHSFSPPPKVDSAVIRLLPYRQPPIEVADIQRLEAVVQAAFNQRRKTIANALKTLSAQAIPDLAGLNIDPKARAENLSLDDFARIANRLTESE